MIRRSKYTHLIPLDGGRELCLHAVERSRVVAAADVSSVIHYFDTPRDLGEAARTLAMQLDCEPAKILSEVAALLKGFILTTDSPEQETRRLAMRFGKTYGRDPVELLTKYQRERAEGASEYWATGAARTLAEMPVEGPTYRIALFGHCDVHMEADFLRIEGRQRGINLSIIATFPDDLRLLKETKLDAIIIGALRTRHRLANPHAMESGDLASALGDEARALILRMRAVTDAPILINSLPLPTVEPIGVAARGLNSHRNRYRAAHLALERVASRFSDVYVVDVDAALGNEGRSRLLDDSLVGFTHFGSLGWLLQRPECERAAVHNLFPDLEPLAQFVADGPYHFEVVLAKTHVDLLVTILDIDRKKCVILDLDGTLWPGVLAETGSPFAWHPSVSGAFSFIGLYFGLHEALKALMSRGILLACVSKNDDATVLDLWRYGDHYPKDILLNPSDFVTRRINWSNKVDNIVSISEELGLSLHSMIFIDDNPVERERVKRSLPQVLVLGEDPFSLRRCLLTDPRLQSPSMTQETSRRTTLVKAQLERDRLKTSVADESAFIASLELRCDVRRLVPGDDVSRLKELFDRTTQFNTTGRRFSAQELSRLLTSKDCIVFSLALQDRFGDHGVVGGCVIQDSEIVILAISCRALGLGIEHTFLTTILDALRKTHESIVGRIIHTPRNAPVRNIYRDLGFSSVDRDNLWKLSLMNAEPADDISIVASSTKRDSRDFT